jgi:hypothetical protein
MTSIELINSNYTLVPIEEKDETKEEDKNQCSICLISFNDSDNSDDSDDSDDIDDIESQKNIIITLECKHKLHENCFIKLLDKGIPNCPMCRANIDLKKINMDKYIKDKEIKLLKCCGRELSVLTRYNVRLIVRKIIIILCLLAVLLIFFLVIDNLIIDTFMGYHDNVKYCDNNLRKCDYYETTGTITKNDISGVYVMSTYSYLNKNLNNKTCSNMTTYDNPFDIKKEIKLNKYIGCEKQIFVKIDDELNCMTEYDNINVGGTISHVIFFYMFNILMLLIILAVFFKIYDDHLKEINE